MIVSKTYYNKEGATMLYPKIGIRPVIDGRWGGVRESLENQTMRMAENAAKLISENLKYPDGTPDRKSTRLNSSH